MKNKILIILVIVFALLLVFQIGYLLGLNKNILQSKCAFKRMPLYGLQDKTFINAQRLATQQRRGLSVTNMMTSGETDKAYIISFSLPGFKKDEIKIDVHKGRLTVFASSKKAIKQDKKGLYQESVSSNNFVQSVKLPQNIINKNISANYNLETLTITIPKDKETRSESSDIIKVLVK